MALFCFSTPHTESVKYIINKLFVGKDYSISLEVLLFIFTNRQANNTIMGNKVSLEEEMINLRIVSKQMQRSSKKCEKNEKQALEKLKKVRRFFCVPIVFPPDYLFW